MRVAAIDLGTNTSRMLIAEAYRGSYRDLDRRMTFTRLGQGVDAGKKLTPEAVGRTLKAIAEFCSVCGEFGVEQIQVAGTSAVRDAANAQEFLALATKLTGRPAIALTGEQEAELSFAGATESMPAGRNLLVCDIGGGSTEFVLGRSGSGTAGRISLDMGSVRMTERFLRSDPPEMADLLLLEGTIDSLLERVAAELGPMDRTGLVGLGGTVTTLGALAAGIEHYTPEVINGLRVGAESLTGLYSDLAVMTTQQRSGLPLMPPGRADVIVAGAAILARIFNFWGFDRVVVSEKDLLDGLVMRMLAGSDL